MALKESVHVEHRTLSANHHIAVGHFLSAWHLRFDPPNLVNLLRGSQRWQFLSSSRLLSLSEMRNKVQTGFEQWLLSYQGRSRWLCCLQRCCRPLKVNLCLWLIKWHLHWWSSLQKGKCPYSGVPEALAIVRDKTISGTKPSRCKLETYLSFFSPAPRSFKAISES